MQAIIKHLFDVQTIIMSTFMMIKCKEEIIRWNMGSTHALRALAFYVSQQGRLSQRCGRMPSYDMKSLHMKDQKRRY